MATAALAIAYFALLVSFIGVHVLPALDQPAATTAASAGAASLLAGALLQQVLLPLATMALFASFALIYGQSLHQAAPADDDTGAGGVGNRRVTELACFVMCASVGLLEFLLFGQQPGGGADGGGVGGAQELGLAAVHAFPAAATATFFLGVMLMYAHLGNGGGGPGGAGAGKGPVPALAMWLLAAITLGAALVTMAGIILAYRYTITK